MKKMMFTFITVFALMSAPALASAEDANQWDKTKASIGKAADWTVALSKQAWNTTKQAAEDLNDEISAKSNNKP